MIEWQSGFPDGELATLLGHAEHASGQAQAYAISTLETCPKVDAQSKFYWTAYQSLGRDRPPAFEGMSQIPYGSILSYANEYDLEGDEREDFKRIIEAIDNREVRLVNDKRRKASEKK